MMSKNLVIQFAKWPEAGKVKTRLAKDLGDEQAKAIHIELMTSVCRALVEGNTQTKVQLSLSANPDQWPDELAEFKQLVTLGNVSITEQVPGNLGERMASAIESALLSFDKVIIVGSDCPTIDSAYLENALTALEDSDIVLGPAEDGGYVLIGASRFERTLFDGVEWGEGKVREQTLSNAKGIGLSVALLETTWDVDELEDYQRWTSVRRPTPDV